MGTPFTSARNGLWDASNVDTWGQGIGVYPQTAADVVNIGHTVTYNKFSTVEMGAITINSGGILTFLNSMSTKLTLGNANLTINSGGELRIGAVGAIIPYNYLAELYFNTTGDNTKGLTCASGGKIVINGDPAYYGSDIDTYIESNWSAPASGASSFVSHDNMSAKWVAGQVLLIHFGKAYVSYANDFLLCTITSISGTTINVTVNSNLGGAQTYNAGGFVLNVSRNVRIGKLSYNQALNQFQTNRPYFKDANTVGAATLPQISNAEIVGVYSFGYGASAVTEKVVVRNGYNGFSSSTANYAQAATIDAIIFSINQKPITNLSVGTINGYIANCNQPVININKSVFNCTFVGNTYCMSSIFNCTGSPVFFGNQYALTNSYGALTASINNLFYSTAIGINPFTGTNIVESLVIASGGNNIFSYSKLSSSISLTRNTLLTPGRASFPSLGQTQGNDVIYDNMGTITKVTADGAGDHPSQRSGGNAYVSEVVAQALINATDYCEIYNVRLWATAGVSKVYRFYVQTDYVTLPTAEIKLYGEYLDNTPAGSDHLASATPSTQGITTRANAADWSQYVEVTINPALDGWVNLYLRLMGYESGKKVWVDPMVVITGGPPLTVTPRWKDADVLLDLDFRSYPIIGGSHVIQPARAA